VIIGSRSQERARAVATVLGHHVQGLANRDAAREASVVIAAVPYEGHADLLAALAPELADKIVVDCVNPLGFDDDGAYPLPVPEGSAAEQAAALLPDSRMVGAFHHVSAVLPRDPQVEALTANLVPLQGARRTSHHRHLKTLSYRTDRGSRPPARSAQADKLNPSYVEQVRRRT
jgi:8-hydroxy-5-deazaflavin:NADPH oxidoreductase